MRIPGAPPPTARQLLRAEDRLSFIYVERCLVSRDSNAVTVTTAEGIVHIPAATIGALLFGPGSKVTHHAMMLLAQSGAVAVWVGEQGVRYYAHGTGLARSTRLLQAQAERVSHRDKRLAVARRMYEMRFPDETIGRSSMQQLRGREGARVRQIYRRESERTGVPWVKREYDPDRFTDGDAINQALSAAHTSLYGVVHSVIVALGCSPGLGFVHTGHHRAFVYDIADLYKAEVTIPIAFEVAASGSEDIPSHTRRAVRDAMRSGSVIERCVRDVRWLLTSDESDDEPDWDIVHLWDDRVGEVMGGVAYGEEPF